MKKWDREWAYTPRGRFEIFIKGDGPPLCITHNYSQFTDSGDYYANLFTLKHKVFLINLKEAGNSDRAEEAHELSLIDTVLDLESIRTALNISKWSFAGHSTGGMIGLIYGIHFSSSLDSLIITGAAARTYMDSKDCIYNEAHPEYERMQEIMEQLKLKNLKEGERKKLTKERTKFSLYHPEKYESYFSPAIEKKISSRRLDFFGREALIFDVTKQLSSISIPTLILCGRHDKQCPLSFSQEMVKLIPKANLVVFEQSSHYPFLEEQEKFLETIGFHDHRR
ncbi:alpha/beta hydrolase [Halobacillus salinarum]|uniref:Alpha/beta hydrolase n=1 Tax=Halobacillus salinarum TaxID=2932257 RepID=A0ABY4EFR5_9BACI|nr:alpha/beta fold hydrolase [Halobacillus salinarum]UOQ42830.1 alpha/beta hydrolase [Halobacillus salinarum]